MKLPITSGIFRLTAALVLATLLAPSTLALAVDTPGISLFGFNGERQLDQSAADPLLLFVMLDNSAALIAEQENQLNKKLVEHYSQTQDYKDMSATELAAFNRQYPIQEVPRIVLGSASVSLESLFDFQIRNQRGETVELKARPLTANDHQARAIELGVQQTLYYQFVLESRQLNLLPPGTYYIVAAIDTTEQPEMWQGWAYSKTMTVTLAEQHPESGWATSNQRALLLGNYLIEDKQYVQAEQHARNWTTQHPDSVDAWSLLGEALYGQGKVPEALESFDTAVRKFREKHGNNPFELPQELLDRIDQIKNLDESDI